MTFIYTNIGKLRNCKLTNAMLVVDKVPLSRDSSILSEYKACVHKESRHDSIFGS